MLLELLLQGLKLIEGNIADVLVLVHVVSNLRILVYLIKYQLEVLKHAYLLTIFGHVPSHLLHLIQTLLTFTFFATC